VRTLLDCQALGPALAELAVDRLDRLDRFARGLGAHRHVARDLTVLVDRGHVGIDPVEIPVLAAVLDQARPRNALLEGGPHVLERLGRHVGVTHDVVRLAQQLILGETADFHEVGVDVSDAALGVGHRHDGSGVAEQVFTLGNGLVDAHIVFVLWKRS